MKAKESMSQTKRATSSCLEGRLPTSYGDVLFASHLGYGGLVAFTASKSEQGVKEYLIARLLDAFARSQPGCAGLPIRAPIDLRKNSLGQPYLLVEKALGPSISFSHSAGLTWAALSDSKGVGIDIAFPGEFDEAYPLSRAFLPDEFNRAKVLCAGNPAEAGALLWSLKEAAVKAMGYGFNFFDPLDIKAVPLQIENDEYLFQVMAKGSLPAWSRKSNGAWLSLSVRV